MEGTTTRNTAVIIVGGIAYYFLYSNLVGVAAAIATPGWFVPFIREYKSLGFILMSLVTTVPAAAISAGLTGYVLARFLSKRHFLFGLLTVGVMVLFSTLTVDYGEGFWGGLATSIWPRHVTQLPMLVALWLFLPFAAAFFGKREDGTRQ